MMKSQAKSLLRFYKAIVLCSSITREYLINYARSLIYTTALGLPTLAMIKSVYAFMKEGGTQKVCLCHFC